jgi:predicted transcriptional regulator
MTTLAKRATIYLEPELHRALQLKAVETSRSISDIVNQSLKQSLAEDAEDLAAFSERAAEPLVSYEAFVQELKAHGKI